MFGYLAEKISGVLEALSKKGSISDSEIEKAVNSIQETLINADVPYKIVKDISQDLRANLKLVNKKSSVNFQERLQALLFNKLVFLMGGEEQSKTLESFEFKSPSIILMVGLQGAGKTTTISKLATFFKNQKKSLRIATTSLDFVRPAAIDQLEILSKKSDIEFLSPIKNNIDQTLKVIIDSMVDKKYDLFFVDTPGRLHINNELMLELRDISMTLNPDHTILVIDSMTGQESLNVARAFADTINLSGAILTKTDSDSKGGVALSLFAEIKKPVLFIGTGEKAGELERFIPKRIASRMIGQGDLETFAEKIDLQISKEDQKNSSSYSEKFLSGQFTLKDFLEQMEMMQKVGPLNKLINYIPGFNKISEEELSQAEKTTQTLRAIIHAMTPKERVNTSLLNTSRIKRIAKGTGITEKEVSFLLNKFEESKQFAKMLGKGKWKDLF